MLVALIAGLAGAVTFSRTITQPLNRAVGVARTVATSDLSTDIRAHGSDEIGELLSTLREMQGNLSMSRVTSIVADISAACNDQTMGIEQVNMAVDQMDEVTQQNAALVEQASAAAQAMAEQAEALRTTVEVFKLKAA
jgi:methyl-accepting chemotaxis protein